MIKSINVTKHVVKYVVFLLLSMGWVYNIHAQHVRIELSDIRYFSDSDTSLIREMTIPIKVNRRSDKVILFQQGENQVKVRFRLSANNSVRRNSLKRSSLDLKMKYKFRFNGKKQKTESTRIFFSDDPRASNERTMVWFRNGITSVPVGITYVIRLTAITP